jgi:hypothetical protein
MTTTFEPAPLSTEVPADNAYRRTPSGRRRRGGPNRDSNLRFFAVILSGMALIAGLFGVGLGLRAVDEAGSGDGGGSGAAPATATVHLTEFALTPSSVQLAEGGTLSVHNDGAVSHDFAIEGTSFRTPILSAGRAPP